MKWTYKCISIATFANVTEKDLPVMERHVDTTS